MAGELSGELYGAGVIRELLRLNPDIKITGIGGAKMKAAGADLLFDISELAVVGVWEVLAQGRAIWRAYHALKKYLIKNRPNLLILIDYPDFNLMLAKVAKKHGIKVLYYISPQVWAWRAGRVKKIAKRVNKMAVILPFEVDIYRNAGLDTSFVGHPLLEIVRPLLSKLDNLTRYKLDAKRPIIGLLPGSRKSEIKFLLDIILDAAKLIYKKQPKVQFIMPVAPSLDFNELSDKIKQTDLPVKLVKAQAYDVMSIADLLITASGTATLEAALLGAPMIVIYKLSGLSYLVGRLLINTPYISLANIIAGKKVVPELIQHEVTANKIAAYALDFLADKIQLKNIRDELLMVRSKLGDAGASRKTAKLAWELINEN